MDTRFAYVLLATLVCLDIGISGLPTTDVTEKDYSFVGVATSIATLTLLKSNPDSNENSVFSPLGLINILTILREGAKGKTQDEIQTALRQPADLTRTRATYKNVLTRYQGEDPNMSPQFKTWFYVYRNNSVEKDFVRSLVDNYYVEVRMIDRDFYDFDQPKSAEPEKDIEASYNMDGVKQVVVANDEDMDEEMKVILKAERMDSKEIDEIIRQKECSKFDEVIEDQQYVEVPAIKKELQKTSETIALLEPVEDNETVQAIEKLEEIKKDSYKDAMVDDNDGALKNLEDLEVMQVAKKHPVTKKFQAARSLQQIGDISSALSGNSIVGKTHKAGASKESKMLLFNGLYFRGRWATPFQKLRSGLSNQFYDVARNSTSEVAMMRSRGGFRVAYSEKFKCKMIEMPYENKRYAMMIIVPSEPSISLSEMIDGFEEDFLDQIAAELKPKTVELSLPKFNIESTRRTENEFTKLGISTLFSNEADLSGINKDQSLRVDELVQHVSVRMDEGASSENGLTATNAVRKKSGEPSEEIFVVDRPFLFALQDVEDSIVLVAGKINIPSGPESHNTFF